MKHLSIYIALLLVFFSYDKVSSQELNAKITLNTSKLQGVDKDIFTALESGLLQILNERQWTNATFSKNERIDCTFVITISSVAGDSYTADIQVNSRRPVFNSAYSTPMFNYKDVDFVFDYIQGQSIEFNEMNIDNNLVAVIAYYAYIIIGVDFDSFSINGGKPYFERAMNIVNAAQMLNTKGWTPFENDRNRYALALALTEESSAQFHTMWYDYHRLGLDEMSSNVSRGRTKILNSVADLQAVHSARPSSPILLFYGDTKMNELVDICEEASPDERKTVYDILRKIYPTRSSDLDKIKGR